MTTSPAQPPLREPLGQPSEGSGCDPVKQAMEDPDWKVGAYFGLSNEETAFGVDSKEGIDLAIDEINKAGGIKGKVIHVLYEDDRSKPDEATNKVLLLIDRERVLALLGEVASSRSRAGALVANKKQIPMISPSSTNPDVTKVGPFVFRACITDDLQSQMGAQFIVNTLGKRKVGLLFASDDLYSSGLANGFRAEVERLGGEIVIERSFLEKETDFTTHINELKSVNPEMIYAPIYYMNMATIAQQAKASGVPGNMFVGTDGWGANELLRDAAEELEGAYFTNHYAPDVPWPISQAFVNKYKERYNRTPSSIAAQGYDAAKLLADAMSRAKGMTPDAIRQAIQDTKGFQGVTGVITIDANRNVDKPLVIARIKDKRFTYYTTVNEKAAQQ